MINAGISVNAVTSVNAPTGNFGLMTAVMMTDVINTGIFDTHVHWPFLKQQEKECLFIPLAQMPLWM
jgi:hypothetical protein